MQGFDAYTGEGVSGKYEILGDDMQILTVNLKDGELLTTEPGTMSFMSNDIKPGVNCGAFFKRCMSANPCIMSTYRGASDSSYVAVTPKLPAKVVPIETGALGGSAMRCKSGSYLAHVGDVTLDFDFDCNCLTCCCAGQGCVRQKVKGTGSAFLTAMGTILTKELAEGEVLVVDTNSVVAWQDTVKLGIKRAGGCCTCCCGGEGMFNTTLTGPGRVYIQSYSKEKFQLALMMLGGGGGGGGGGGSTAYKVLLVAGPQGTGRSELVAKALLGAEDAKDGAKLAAPKVATTRPPKDGEAESGKFVFLDRLSYDQQLRDGKFVTSDDPADNQGKAPWARELTGLRLEDLLEAGSEGKVAVVDCADTNAADRVALALEARSDVSLVGVWVSLSALADFEARLGSAGGKGGEGGEGELSEEDRRAALQAVIGDIEWGVLSGLFDFTVINDDEPRALGELQNAIDFLDRAAGGNP